MGDSLAAAVWADPDDDLPRLIYADYLEERGDPRGAFIRAQIALANAQADDPLRAELSAEEDKLLAHHQAEWLGELADGLVLWWFHRGFLEVALDIARYLHEPNLWLNRPTVAGIRLYAPRVMERELLEELASSPRAQRVRQLYLGFEWVRDAGAQVIADSPHFTRLISLDLETNGLSEEGARAIADSPNLPALRHLSLNNNLLGDGGAIAIAESPHMARLRQLDLLRNEFTSVGAMALAESPHLLNLRQLNLAGNLFNGRHRGGKALRRRFGERVRWKTAAI